MKKTLLYLILNVCFFNTYGMSQTAKGGDLNARIVKYEETFASIAAYQSWTIVNADGSIASRVGGFVTSLSYPNGSSVAPKAGTYFWSSNFNNSNGTLLDEWLISPELPTVAEGDTVIFYAGAPNTVKDDSIQVWLSTTDPQGNVSAFQYNLGRIKADGPTGNWTAYKFAIDLPQTVDSPVWLGLRYWLRDGGIFGDNSDNVWIDYISVTGKDTTTVDINVSAGWNLVGTSVALSDSSVNSVFPNHLANTLFEFDGSYQLATELACGKGYWLFFNSSETISLIGIRLDNLQIDLNEGWNLISGASCSINLGDISDPGGIIIPNTLFTFNGSYVSATAIEAGKAYWIRASEAGSITLNCD